MTLRSRLAASRFARAAALPGRAAAAGSHVASEVALSSRWLVTSREHHNYTYNLTPRNLTHLAWWVSAVTGAEVADCRAWIDEVLNDPRLAAHVVAATAASDRRGLADLDFRIARRAGWYAVVRGLEPDHVVETGTDKGLGSVVLAAALLRNGRGHLTTMDINPAAGYLVSGDYSSVTTVVIGDSIASLTGLTEAVDVFVHDSDHSAEHEAREFRAIEGHLEPSARVLSDNSHATDSLALWAESTNRRFLYFQERPDRHWYEGAGIGAAW